MLYICYFKFKLSMNILIFQREFGCNQLTFFYFLIEVNPLMFDHMPYTYSHHQCSLQYYYF